MPAANRFARGPLGGHQPGKSHERRASPKSAPVTDLAGDGARAQMGDTTLGAQPVSGLGERTGVDPVGELGLDRLEGDIAFGGHSPVVIQCGL
jgi:hypothetical protein